MGMSTHVVGFRPADDQWKKMLAVWVACKAAKVEPPQHVSEFFGHEDPEDKPGVEVSLSLAIQPWSDESASGFEVDLTRLPAGLRYLRFYNSW